MREMAILKFRASAYWRLLLTLLLTGFAIPLVGVSAYAQDSYYDPAFGEADTIITSSVFTGNKQGRVPAMEGMFTKQMSSWLSDSGEVLMGEVVHVGQGCNADTYLANPAGKIALIERGACPFVEKITRAYESGAIGAIVYNSVIGVSITMVVPPDCLLCVDVVPIPGFFLSRSDGLTLAANPVTVKIQSASLRVLKDGVTSLVEDGTLSKQQAGSLKDKISAASDAVNAQDFETAISLLREFRLEILDLRTDLVLPFLDWRGLNFAAFIIQLKLQPPFTDA